MAAIAEANAQIPGRLLDIPSSTQQSQIDDAITLLQQQNFPSGDGLASGAVTICVDNMADNTPATSDADTIGVNVDVMGTPELAIVLNHEYTHVLSRGGQHQDPATSAPYPIGFCNHVSMAAADLQNLHFLDAEGYEPSCEFLDTLTAAVNAGIDQCLNAGGSCNCALPSGQCDCY